MSSLKIFNAKCQNCLKLYCNSLKNSILILLFFLYCSTVASDKIKRENKQALLFPFEQNHQDIVEVDSDTFSSKYSSCKRFLACERRRIHLQNQGNGVKMSCTHLLNQEDEFGVQLKRHKRRISSKRKMRACLQRINRNKKHSMKDKEKTQVVVAGVGTFPASHLFPDNKQQIIPYGNRKEIEKVLERNPTPSDFNDFSTDYSTTTILTPKTQSLNKEENNKNEQIEIAKNLEKERRRLARLLRVMTNMGTENDLDIPSGPPEWMSRISNSLGYPHRPSQYMADHQPKGIFPATRKVQQQRKTAAAIKQLVGNNNNSVFKKFEARKSFALPSWVNLTEMGILAARPHLAKLESWRLLNAAKSAKERIRKQQAALTAKAFGVKNEVIKTNNTKNSTNKIVKSLKMTSSNTSIPHKSAPPLAKTTPSEKEKLTLTKSFSSSVFPSSPTSPPTSLYNMKFTQIWTKKKSETTTIKTTLDNINNITLKKQANEEDKSSTETVIDPKSWEDIDALVPLTQKKELANSPTNQTNKKHQKITTASTTIKTTLFPKLQTKQNNLNKTKTVIRHSGQTVMKQLETQKKRVEITLESSKHSFNNQTIIPFSSLSSNLTKNHFHLSGVKTIKTTKNSKELNKKSTKNPSKNQKINNLPNKLINSREELEHLRNALLKNLEKFLKNKGKVETKNTKQKRFIEPPSILFYSKEDSERMGLNLNHCSLFINCKAYLEQLKSSKLNCSDSLFPLIETKNKNNPKRRRSASERCNARLLPLFKRAEMATNELERETLKCVENSLKEKNKPIKSSIKCHQNWPLLTPLFPQLNCSEKIIRLQHHCENLGKCCSNLKNCQEQINSTGLSRRIQIEKQRLTQRSEQCELQANEMFNNISERKKMVTISPRRHANFLSFDSLRI